MKKTYKLLCIKDPAGRGGLFNYIKGGQYKAVVISPAKKLNRVFRIYAGLCSDTITEKRMKRFFKII